MVLAAVLARSIRRRASRTLGRYAEPRSARSPAGNGRTERAAPRPTQSARHRSDSLSPTHPRAYRGSARSAPPGN